MGGVYGLNCLVGNGFSGDVEIVGGGNGGFINGSRGNISLGW